MAAHSTTTSSSTMTSSSSPAPRPGAHEIAHRLNEETYNEGTHIVSLVRSLGRESYRQPTPQDPIPGSPAAGGDFKSFTRSSVRKEPRSAFRQPLSKTPGGMTSLEAKRTPAAAHPLESKGNTPAQLMSPPHVVVEIADTALVRRTPLVFEDLVRTEMRNVRGLGSTVVIDTLPHTAPQPGGMSRNLLSQFQTQTPAKGGGLAAPAVVREEEDELRDGAQQPAANPGPMPPNLQAGVEPLPPAAEPQEGQALAGALNLHNDPVLEARLDGCRRLAATRVQQRQQDPGYLDRLWRAYIAHIPAHEHLHHERTLETVASLVDYNIAPEQIPQSSFWGHVRDFFSQMAGSQTGYLSSWYPAGAVGIALAEAHKDELAKIFFPALMAAGGLLMGTRMLRKGDLYPTWTRPYSFDHTNNAPRGLLDGWNFARAVAAYWGFAPTLALITHYVQPDNGIADPTARKTALGIALTKARMKYNFISSAMVGLHRYFILPRELTFLNALDAPGTPEERRGENRRAMIGAIQELSAPRDSRFPGLVAAGRTLVAPAGYVKHVFIGAGRMLLLDEAWGAARACYDGKPVNFRYSADSATRDLSRLSLLFTAAILLNLLRAWGGHPGEDTPKWNYVLDIAALPLFWGLGTALADRLNLDNASIREDNQHNASGRLARLAEGVPHDPIPPAPPIPPIPPAQVAPIPPAQVAPPDSASELEPQVVNIVLSPHRPRRPGGPQTETKQGGSHG